MFQVPDHLGVSPPNSSQYVNVLHWGAQSGTQCLDVDSQVPNRETPPSPSLLPPPQYAVVLLCFKGAMLTATQLAVHLHPPTGQISAKQIIHRSHGKTYVHKRSDCLPLLLESKQPTHMVAKRSRDKTKGRRCQAKAKSGNLYQGCRSLRKY